MSSFYGSSLPAANPNHLNSVIGCVKTSLSLGIFTKTHVIRSQEGLERVHDFLLQDQSAKLLPKERVRNCLKKRIDKTKNRNVRYNEIREKAHWSNVQRCGSVWTCPVCAKQITEKRRDELKRGIETWKNEHMGDVLLMTLTFSHSIKEPLSTLLERQRAALKIFHETTKVQALLKQLGVQYKIKSLETTYGTNGWHPHNHFLLLVDTLTDYSQIKNELAQHWIKSCKKAGLSAPSMTHGLDIRDGTYATKYVAKWGLSEEMTKGHLKKGRSSCSPFDLLNYSTMDVTIGDRTAADLWQEFAIATKGKRQLEWGRGLKKLLLIDEKTDEQLAQETDQDSIELLEVDQYVFALLCSTQNRHTYLRCLEQDYKNGCFGNGLADALLEQLLLDEIARLEQVA